MRFFWLIVLFLLAKKFVKQFAWCQSNTFEAIIDAGKLQNYNSFQFIINLLCNIYISFFLFPITDKCSRGSTRIAISISIRPKWGAEGQKSGKMRDREGQK
jgi:hypothetical protein